MTAEQNQALEKGIIIAAAVADADAATSTVSVDPRDIPRAAYARIAAMNFPTPERERQAARLVASHSPRINELIRNGNDFRTIRGEVAAMEEACRRLTIPEKMPSFRDELERMHDLFRQASWTPEEAQALKAFWHDGDRINSIAITSVNLGEREIARSAVRGRLKGIVTNARLDECERREREALDLEAENKRRREHGTPRKAGDIGLSGGDREPIHRHW